jgi:hypothetical protein
MKDNTNDNMVNWTISAFKTTKDGVAIKNTDVQCDTEEAGELLQHSANIAILFSAMAAEIGDLLEDIEEIGLHDGPDLNESFDKVKTILVQSAMYMVKSEELNDKLTGGAVR